MFPNRLEPAALPTGVSAGEQVTRGRQVVHHLHFSIQEKKTFPSPLLDVTEDMLDAAYVTTGGGHDKSLMKRCRHESDNS